MKATIPVKRIVFTKKAKYKLISEHKDYKMYNVTFKTVELPLNIGSRKRPYKLSELKYSKLKLKTLSVKLP